MKATSDSNKFFFSFSCTAALVLIPDIFVLVFKKLQIKCICAQRAADGKIQTMHSCGYSLTLSPWHYLPADYLPKHTSARFYELGLTRDSRVIPGLTVVSVLSTSNLGLNWD